jgi:hypothetical protein
MKYIYEAITLLLVVYMDAKRRLSLSQGRGRLRTGRRELYLERNVGN